MCTCREFIYKIVMEMHGYSDTHLLRFRLPVNMDYSLVMPGLVQVDVTSKTEGRAFADATGVPLLVKYDTRLKENVAKNIVQDVTDQVQVRALRFTAVHEQLVLLRHQASTAPVAALLLVDHMTKG